MDGSELTSGDAELLFLHSGNVMLGALAALALVVACASLAAYYRMRGPKSRQRRPKSNQIDQTPSIHVSTGVVSPKRTSRNSYLNLLRDEDAEEIARIEEEGPLSQARSTAAGDDQDAVAGLEANPSFRAIPRTASIRKAGGSSPPRFGKRGSSAKTVCDGNDSERTETYRSDSQGSKTCDDSGRTAAAPTDAACERVLSLVPQATDAVRAMLPPSGESERPSHLNDFGLTRGLSALRSFMRGETLAFERGEKLERRHAAQLPPPPLELVDPEFIFDPVTNAYRRARSPAKLPKMPDAPRRDSQDLAAATSGGGRI